LLTSGLAKAVHERIKRPFLQPAPAGAPDVKSHIRPGISGFHCGFGEFFLELAGVSRIALLRKPLFREEV